MNWMQGIGIILDLALRINSGGTLKSTGKRSAVAVARGLGFQGRTAADLLPNVVLSMMAGQPEWEVPGTVVKALEQIGVSMEQMRWAVAEVLEAEAAEAV